ncbi:uncharacterized protein KIAA2012 homolog [Notechis scutatus]|uniref:Uncharacterized protein KIAA2012 homolog n=1 Tax=Notechis scutatus TaxID=8663 RepID=A0A6J1V2W0_9SAUR|nr:uncharacterized protein KIAA2012 homolog [Notechis scutatus]
MEEQTHKRDSGQEDVEVEPISCLVEEQGEEEEREGDQSLPDSSIFMEEHPLTLDMNQMFSEEVGNISGFHPGPASETSIATYKAVSTANGFQADAQEGNQLMEVRQMAELEKEQQFQYQLLVEACGLDRRQDISRPWVYSYFQRSFTTEDD